MAQSRPGYCIMAFLTKHPSLSPTEFRTYYETTHIPLVQRTLAAGGAPPGLPLVYTRRYIDPKTPIFTASGQLVGFDCVSETQFASKEDFERHWIEPLTGERGKIVVEDEKRFLDREKSVAYQFEMCVTETGGGGAEVK